MDYERLENLLISHGLTVYKLSKETGIAPSTFSDWKSGRSLPKIEKLKKIAEYFGVGIGYFLEEESLTTPELKTYQSVRAKKMIPIIGEIRAGSPIITNETLLGHEFADVDDAEEYFYLRVLGDSMKNVGMVDGSLVLFRKQQYAENGDIVACLVGGECATVKRFERHHKKIRLLPENEAYSPIELTTDSFEAGDARILGVAVEVKIKL